MIEHARIVMAPGVVLNATVRASFLIRQAPRPVAFATGQRTTACVDAVTEPGSSEVPDKIFGSGG